MSAGGRAARTAPAQEQALFSRLFKAQPHRAPAEALYRSIVAQARQPAFYTDCGVPDSLDGRFELIVLHCFLLLHRLKGEAADSDGLAQALHDMLFLDMDRSLRELGVGDLGVGPRVKRMAQGFYGRCAAYEDGLSADDAVLADALRRNLYGTVAPPADLGVMAAYLRREAAALHDLDLAALLAGRFEFGAPPACPADGRQAAKELAETRGDKAVDRS